MSVSRIAPEDLEFLAMKAYHGEPFGRAEGFALRYAAAEVYRLREEARRYYQADGSHVLLGTPEEVVEVRKQAARVLKALREPGEVAIANLIGDLHRGAQKHGWGWGLPPGATAELLIVVRAWITQQAEEAASQP